MHNVSRVMSTQHPDNVTQPFFAESNELSGDDEIKEVFYAHSHLRCKEQLWDCEGKEVDAFVVKKLLSKYEPFFRKNILGKDVFLTLRVPNPSVERNEAKILLETLESLPRSFDTARLFYGEDISPIFEVALPMTTSSEELLRLSHYYKNHVIGKQHSSVFDIKISDWIGKFLPEEVKLIPLFEESNFIVNSADITKQFIEKEKTKEYQRVWLARSDPALNYGNIATVLLLKVGLMNLQNLQEECSLDILPILGCGSAPFRGNLKPNNVDLCLKEYPSVHTFTIQSAFKYDYPLDQVTKAVNEIESKKPKQADFFDHKKCLEIANKLTSEYQKQIKLLIPLINNISQYVPSRRKRKLHIGLFGYSRNLNGMHLPRAINFCASLYSLGLPPELIGMHVLSEQELSFIREVYKNFDIDMMSSLQHLNKDNLKIFPKEVSDSVLKTASHFNFNEDERHKKITSIIANDLGHADKKLLTENITRAGFIRGFLG